MKLDVPHIVQRNEGACGIAAFEMVYRYYRGRDAAFDRNALFKQYASPNLTNSRTNYVLTYHIVEAARAAGFFSESGIFPHDPAALRATLSHCLDDLAIPVIACVRLSDSQPLDGHFRVIKGIEGDELLVHDPAHYSGKSQRWSFSRLWESWRPSGPSVVGGVGILISPTAVTVPLGDVKMLSTKWPGRLREAPFPGFTSPTA